MAHSLMKCKETQKKKGETNKFILDKYFDYAVAGFESSMAFSSSNAVDRFDSSLSFAFSSSNDLR